MAVSWEYFVGRRRLRVKEWMSRKNITSYADFVGVLNGMEIAPPKESTVAHYFRPDPEEGGPKEKLKKSAVPSHTPEKSPTEKYGASKIQKPKTTRRRRSTKKTT